MDKKKSELVSAYELMRTHHYQRAREILEQNLKSGDQSKLVQIALARCSLALGDSKHAIRNYKLILQQQSSHIPDKVEAALVLGHFSKALNFVNRKKIDFDADLFFLLALAEYKSGFINLCQQRLNSAVEQNLEWDDDDPLDHVAQYVLENHEYHDFEQIYLDVIERLDNDGAIPQNRWFSLNMPVFEVLSASRKSLQNERALDLAQLLSRQFNDLFIGDGRQELGRILEDLAQSEVNAEFGLQARQALEEKNYSHIAELILALQLDHLKQFAAIFGLSDDIIQQSRLQTLIPLLPLKLAVSMLFLYSTSEPKDKPPNYLRIQLEEDIFAGLIAACFIVYYQQIEQYRATSE